MFINIICLINVIDDRFLAILLPLIRVGNVKFPTLLRGIVLYKIGLEEKP